MLYAINTNPGGTGNGTDTSTDDWNGGQTYSWDFSVADNYVASGPTIAISLPPEAEVFSGAFPLSFLKTIRTKINIP